MTSGEDSKERQDRAVPQPAALGCLTGVGVIAREVVLDVTPTGLILGEIFQRKGAEAQGRKGRGRLRVLNRSGGYCERGCFGRHANGADSWRDISTQSRKGARAQSEEGGSGCSTGVGVTAREVVLDVTPTELILGKIFQRKGAEPQRRKGRGRLRVLNRSGGHCERGCFSPHASGSSRGNGCHVGHVKGLSPKDARCRSRFSEANAIPGEIPVGADPSALPGCKWDVCYPTNC